jgi:phage terminase large subunit-like protein
MLLIEEKDSGIDVVNEMKRLYGNETWALEGIVPIRDKISRALSVQPVFTQGHPVGIAAPLERCRYRPPVPRGARARR